MKNDDEHKGKHESKAMTPKPNKMNKPNSKQKREEQMGCGAEDEETKEETNTT